MAPAQRNQPPVRGALVDASSALFGATFLGAMAYYLVGLLHNINAVNNFSVLSAMVTALQVIASVAAAVAGGYDMFGDLRRKAAARRATQLVAEAVEKVKEETPGKSAAELPSAKQIAQSVQGARVSPEHVEQLAEQERQKLLIDEVFFRKELSVLIVDYLQPLPRNAKRVVNRFRVNLLIAQRRGLMTSEPKVSAKQIGKWLVLGERWPQLGRSLATTPERMKRLEAQAKERRQPTRDPFTLAIKSLAAPYVGDGDLRRFIRSDPSLAIVLSRLVHYGADTSDSSQKPGA